MRAQTRPNGIRSSPFCLRRCIYPAAAATAAESVRRPWCPCGALASSWLSGWARRAPRGPMTWSISVTRAERRRRGVVGGLGRMRRLLRLTAGTQRNARRGHVRKARAKVNLRSETPGRDMRPSSPRCLHGLASDFRSLIRANSPQ